MSKEKDTGQEPDDAAEFTDKEKLENAEIAFSILQTGKEILQEEKAQLQKQVDAADERFKQLHIDFVGRGIQIEQLQADRDAHSKVRQRHLVRLGKCGDKIEELQKQVEGLKEGHKSLLYKIQYLLEKTGGEATLIFIEQALSGESK